MITRRTYSVPERLTLFGTGCAVVGRLYPTLMRFTHGHGVPCPLRTLTGVPCPFCGLTTATVALAHGQWAAAATASPLACMAAVMVAGTAPVLVARNLGLADSPRPMSESTRKRITYGAYAVVALSWVYQLRRFGFL
jgi:glycerol-3-phosphate acyltransferase PlsY